MLFDLLNNRELAVINPASAFQYYDLARLSDDLAQVIRHGIRLLNVATEPVSTETIIRRFFPTRIVGEKAGARGFYDFRSCHAGLWGGVNGYLYSATTVLDDLGRYLATQPQYAAPPVAQ